jgi:hypothetical protein
MLQVLLLDRKHDAAAVERIWLDLCRECAHPYFLSWAWVENWLATLPSSVDVRLAVVENSAGPIGACFLGHNRVCRHFFVRSDTLLVNQTGVADPDSVCIEYNRVLTRPHAVFSVFELAQLLGDQWEEIRIANLDPSTKQLDGMPAMDARVIIERSSPSPFVDLARVRAEGYLPLLSANTRSQIRRSYRVYEEKYGPVPHVNGKHNARGIRDL